MNISFANIVPPDGVQKTLAAGGFCHRLPMVSPMPVQGPLGQPDMLVLSGFGSCQKALCPKWDGSRCVEAEPAHVERLRMAEMAAEDEAKKAEPAEGSRIVTP